MLNSSADRNISSSSSKVSNTRIEIGGIDIDQLTVPTIYI